MSLLPDKFSTEVNIPTDDDSYLDRACPDEVCGAEFKVLVDDWQDKVRDEEVFCPHCGHTATSDNWFSSQMNRWNKLQRYFQQRHILAHKDGIVDDEYRQKTGDRQHQSGQRLVIKESDVMLFTDLVEKLTTALQGACASAIEDERINE